MSTNNCVECPICMDIISDGNNVTTECGHKFHCTCLVLNIAHNGFDCPYCRSEMINETEEEEVPTLSNTMPYYFTYSYLSHYGIEELTTFRMFHQQLSNIPVEEEPSPEPDEVDDEATEYSSVPAEMIIEKFKKSNITYEDLVKTILYHDFKYSNPDYFNYDSIAQKTIGITKSCERIYRRSNPELTFRQEEYEVDYDSDEDS